MVSLTQAILISLLYWISQSRFTYAFLYLNWPVVHGFFLGLIMGNPIMGTILGGTLQTLNMAPSNVGNTVTMDMKMAGFIVIPMALAGGIDPETVIAFAVPFTVIGAFIQPVTRTLFEFGVKMYDDAASTGNTAKAQFANNIIPLIITFPFYFGVMFLALYYGQGAMSALLNILPEWLMITFITVAKFLPGIGFAMFLRSTNRMDRLPLFFLGFYIMYYFSESLSLLSLTVFGVIIAFIVVLGNEKTVSEGGV